MELEGSLHTGHLNKRYTQKPQQQYLLPEIGITTPKGHLYKSSHPAVLWAQAFCSWVDDRYYLPHCVSVALLKELGWELHYLERTFILISLLAFYSSMLYCHPKASLPLSQPCIHWRSPTILPRVLWGDPVVGIWPHLSDHLSPDVATSWRPVWGLPARLLWLLYRYGMGLVGVRMLAHRKKKQVLGLDSQLATRWFEAPAPSVG